MLVNGASILILDAMSAKILLSNDRAIREARKPTTVLARISHGRRPKTVNGRLAPNNTLYLLACIWVLATATGRLLWLSC